MDTASSQSRFYDGRLYAALIEPFQRRLHRRILGLVPEGASVLDACCGAGGLSLRLAPQCPRVVGLDLSPRQIEFAELRRRRRALRDLEFRVADVTRLEGLDDDAFDLAIAVLALHEMSREDRVPCLREIGRVGRRVLVVDYAVPLPRSPVGVGAWIAEAAAGPRHFWGFRDYYRRGGLDPLLEEAGLTTEHRERCEGDGLLLTLSRNLPPGRRCAP